MPHSVGVSSVATEEQFDFFGEDILESFFCKRLASDFKVDLLASEDESHFVCE